MTLWHAKAFLKLNEYMWNLSTIKFQPCLIFFGPITIAYHCTSAWLLWANWPLSIGKQFLWFLAIIAFASIWGKFERTGGQNASACPSSVSSKAYKLCGCWEDGVLVENSSADYLSSLHTEIVASSVYRILTLMLLQVHSFLFFSLHLSFALPIHKDVIHHMMNTLFTLFDRAQNSVLEWTSYTENSDLMRYVRKHQLVLLRNFADRGLKPDTDDIPYRFLAFWLALSYEASTDRGCWP